MNEIEVLNEEVFCLKYELNIFSKAMCYGKLERWVLNFSYSGTEKEHIQRYELVCPYLEGKRILDIACGTGIGSYMMATIGNPLNIDGVDLNPDTIRYATFRNGHPKISFQKGDAVQFISETQYDVIISFETVEHILNYAQYLQQLAKNLHEDGLLFISTPISDKRIDEQPKNPYHIREWGFKAFQDAISEHFDISQIFIQVYLPQKKRSFFRKVYHKFYPPQYNSVQATTTIYDYSVSNIDERLLGNTIKGYQILVCKKIAK